MLKSIELQGPPKPIRVEYNDETEVSSSSRDETSGRPSSPILSNASSSNSSPESLMHNTRLEIPCENVVNPLVEQNSGDSFPSYFRVTNENSNVGSVPAVEPSLSTLSAEDVQSDSDEEQVEEVETEDVDSQSGGNADYYSTVGRDMTSGDSVPYAATSAKLSMFSVPEGKPSQPMFNE